MPEKPILPNETPAVSRFDTRAVPPSDRFTVWKESIAVLFDVQLPEDSDGEFTATLTTVQLGPLLIGDTRACRQTFRRDAVRANSDGIDHYLIQLYLDGDARARFHDAERTIAAGDLLLIDAAQPSYFDCNDFRNLTLVVPRALLDARLPDAERLHGRELPRDHPAVGLLAGNLRLMQDLAAGFPAETAGSIADTLLDLTARCLAAAGSGLTEAAPELKVATLTSVKRFLEARLDNANLGPDSVLHTFRMSRAYLYELFEPYGGVVRYIQQRRLARCLNELQAPANRRRKIADIAFAYGFTSESHFSRAFRKAFGITPSQARAMQPVQRPPPGDHDPVDRRYEEWLRVIK